MDDPLFMREVKTLISINDKSYLEKLLNDKKLLSQSALKKLEHVLSTDYDFDVAHSICRQGSIGILEFFRSKNKEFNLDFVDDQGLNCLHHAVSKNRREFVEHLLFRDSASHVDVNQQSLDKGESPLFFALGKIKNDQEKLKMV